VKIRIALEEPRQLAHRFADALTVMQVHVACFLYDEQFL
jgi:hypothetical protein